VYRELRKPVHAQRAQPKRQRNWESKLLLKAVFLLLGHDGRSLLGCDRRERGGGFSIGMSPAVSEKGHVKVYHLPVDYFDIIIFTGFNYSGRNLLLTRSSDAVVFVCGRMGTLNEFTIAFEDGKPIGVLEGTGGIADRLREIVENSHRGFGNIVYDTDPESG